MKSLKQLMDLNGRVALVTGGGGHIGSALCEGLAELGASIIVLDVAAEAGHKVASELEKKYDVQAISLAVDLQQEGEIGAVPEMIRAHFDQLDILVNCAGLVGTSGLKDLTAPFMEQGSTTWRLALEVNLTAVFLLIQACAPMLAARKIGSIINVSSIYGMVGTDLSMYEGTAMGSSAAYGASKAGLLQLTRWLSTMLAPAVRVNSITPGGVQRGQPEEFQGRYVERTPLKRMAVEEDFKGAAAYLASDMSAYVTGHNLVVDGGWTVW
jgi:NAD(P)-dependent dehydrogenase (short-subunit alcohol dehydrogenase family)